YVWAKASDATGHSAEAWLQTVEPYRFTAEIAILAVERTAELNRVGALTPALAFGADFVLEVPGTQRFDSLS
ncbi:MAG: saccharopine dehydrogenase, partial [Aggregatilineales bacterium]